MRYNMLVEFLEYEEEEEDDTTVVTWTIYNSAVYCCVTASQLLP